MPKSKKRRMKHAPRRKAVQQQPLASTKQPADRTPTPVQATALPEATTAPVKTKINRTIKTQVIPQISNVATELKVIGSITIILLAIIVVLYFIFR